MSMQEVAGGPSGRRSKLRPLAALAPFALRYKGRIIAAFVALGVASAATLAVPLALRRVIDFGFTQERLSEIDSYFLAILGVAAVLALASASRYLSLIHI